MREGDGDKPAIFQGAEMWSYHHLARMVDRIGRVLTEDLAVRPGHRVLLRAPNGPMLAACLLAVIKVGAVAVPTMPLLRGRELAQIIDKAQIGVALVAADMAEAVKEAGYQATALQELLSFGDGSGLDRLIADKRPGLAPAPTMADDPAVILFTAGTTGHPKAAVHCHRDLLAITDCFGRHVMAPHADDVLCGTSSLAFAYGLCTALLIPLRFRASVAYIERAQPDLVAATLRHRGISILISVPTLIQDLVASLPKPMSRLRLTITAGEPLAPALLATWNRQAGVPILDGLGSTELLYSVVSATADNVRPGSFGRAVAGYDAVLFDNDDQIVDGPGSGRLAIKGPTGCRYLADPERQRLDVRDGWSLTGDIVRRDAEGFFYYQSRVDAIVVSGGYTIAADEIEAVLREHPWVADCVVVAADDPHRGHIVKAFVIAAAGVARDATTIAELQDFVKHRLAPYKYPRAITFVDELPGGETRAPQRDTEQSR